MVTLKRDFIAGSANTISRAVLWLNSPALSSPIVVFAIDNLVAIANAYNKVFTEKNRSTLLIWISGNSMHAPRTLRPD